ncbi:hypothetical protein ACFYUY_38435 [Kitasatospora sp. NPDC004745]|uniref:hypothetical protein n=1 Tax=Kitasatospora sp. NPDC004745 TaxID=3364019 RepID=UPI0036A8DE30
MSLRSGLGRRPLFVSALGAAIAAAVFGYALLMGDGASHHTGAPRANDVSGRATACLAADSASTTGGDTVTRIWSAMQSAGSQHDANVQQVVEPAANAEQAFPHLAGLLVQHCDLIVTVGAPFGQATPGIAAAAPSVPIIAVDSTLATTPPNVTLLTGPDAVAWITERVGGLQRRASGT